MVINGSVNSSNLPYLKKFPEEDQVKYESMLNPIIVITRINQLPELTTHLKLRCFMLMLFFIAVFIIDQQPVSAGSWRERIENLRTQNDFSTIPPTLQVELKKLSSSDAVERCNAAISLGNMGHKAAPLVVFLIELLDDRTSLEWRRGSIGTPTSVSREAGEALGRIGEPAADQLMKILQEPDAQRGVLFYQDAIIALGLTGSRKGASFVDILIS